MPFPCGLYASSNWGANATANDPNNPGVQFSQYSPGHRAFLALSYRHEYFKFGATAISLFTQGFTQGNTSYTFSADANGDGATNEGAFHEAVNLAAIWQLPVVFVCENNKYGMSFSTEKSMHVEHVADRAAAYGIPGVRVEGNDADAMYLVCQEAVDRARSGNGPTLVESVTYRWKGHSKSDKNLYRTKEEIEEWRAKDPIVQFENKVIERGVLTREDVDAVAAATRDKIRVAIQEATTAPDSDPAELLSSVFRAVQA